MGVSILLISLIVLVIIGVPLCFSMGASGLIYFLIMKPTLISILPQRVWAGCYSFVLTALPMFILAGELMNHGGITKRIINFCLYIVKPFHGGLAEVNVVASMVFGGISGSSVADTSALGSILIPQMEENGYEKGFSAGVTVASSTMGMIIPPSIPMLMYAMISNDSIGALFLAGAIPGILIGITQVFVVHFLAKKKGYVNKNEKIFKWNVFLREFGDGLLAIAMPLIIVLSVSFGIATATESAGIAVLYAFILGKFVYKELEFKDVWKAIKNTVRFSSSVLYIVGFSTIYTWILSVEHVPQNIAAFLVNLDVPIFVIFIIVDIIILLVGAFVDVAPAIYLLGPVLIPVMSQLGMSSLQLGALLIVGLAIGLVTPPVGMCLNAANKICNMQIMEISKKAMPFITCNLFVMVLITFVPAVSTWLPSLAF
ncbi:MAG: TRAP transporter large permease [Sphaerochaetaceae bacterium]|nr:TRAP transporter large permease [Sphaerochaetaceae bacterium]MDC7251167.1 TRAP transporter large permease [Sphaerochaetaceae bacterium]